jgi:hypothetical protein
LRDDTAAQRFSVYRRKTYHDKNMIRDNSAKVLMCFADGDALAFPDAWMPEDHPQKGTNLDPEVNTELNVYEVCERLNKDHTLAARYVWGPGYKVGWFRFMRFVSYLVVYPGLLALAWWLVGFWHGAFTAEHPSQAIALIWFALFQVWGVLVFILVGVGAVVDAKRAKAA